jgi:hypothetical protein
LAEVWKHLFILLGSKVNFVWWEPLIWRTMHGPPSLFGLFKKLQSLSSLLSTFGGRNFLTQHAGGNGGGQ